MTDAQLKERLGNYLHSWPKDRGECAMNAEAFQAVSSFIAALVGEYGHALNCKCSLGCDTPGCSVTHTVYQKRDPRCLPESREEKP